MEYAVLHYLDDVMETMNVCRCEKCKMDVIALTLNRLPPKYVVTETGELFSKVDLLKTQFEVDIVSAIAFAAEKVKNHPLHDIKG